MEHIYSVHMMRASEGFTKRGAGMRDRNGTARDGHRLSTGSSVGGQKPSALWPLEHINNYVMVTWLIGGLGIYGPNGTTANTHIGLIQESANVIKFGRIFQRCIVSVKNTG